MKLVIVLLCLLTIPVAWADDFSSAGVRIHYVVKGQGSPVVLVHGLYSSIELNWGRPGTLDLLAQRHQVIALDCRGHGQSDKPTAEDAYGVQMVEDVVRLMDHLHIPKADVVGYSMGGIIVMKLMVLHPERVRVAVLGGMGMLKEGSPVQHIWENMGKSRKGGATPPACLRGIAQLAVTPAQVQAITLPVTMISGDRDPVKALYVDPAHKLRPDWPLVLVPGAGHVDCIWQPTFLKAVQAAVDH
jgi:pimeloyl-ACP methyl ester carboxylesterase